MANDLISLKTASEVVDALGGTAAVMTLTQSVNSQRVSNWVSRNRFSAPTFLVMTAALEAHGFMAPPTLWGLIEPAEVGG